MVAEIFIVNSFNVQNHLVSSCSWYTIHL